MDALLYISAGAGVGFAVGLTGIGGGSLMTPLLLLFGFPAHIAIGTDLMYAALTKAGGVTLHHRQSSIDWKLVKTLCAGSIPATVVTILVLKYLFAGSDHYSPILTTCLGFMLTLTAVVVLLSEKLKPITQKAGQAPPYQEGSWLTVSMGATLGILVTLCSVGAGALGTAILLLLYPMLAPVKVVGTDLAHAVPLTFTAGLGHIWLGNVDFSLLGALLIGSLPAIYLGTRLGKHLPDKILKWLLAGLLFGLGVRYFF